LPSAARKVALVAFDDAPSRLRGLIGLALRQDAAVVLVSNSAGDTLPDEVEVQPLSALTDILEWTEHAAMDVGRENLRQLIERIGKWKPLEAQILIRTPVPCGGIADCGVCAVTLKDKWKLACKDGPVFDWREL
jgi:dihydroorotate dehydrogenase electron transfer subunit